MVAIATPSASLKEYLERYEIKNEGGKKKMKVKPDAVAVTVLDEDLVWRKPVKLEEDENDDSEDEEKALVDEGIEVKRMKRLEQLRVRRPFGAISEHGSGWVPISNAPNQWNSEDQNSDIYLPHKHRVRNDSPSPEPGLTFSGGSRQVTDFSPPQQLRRCYHTPSPEPETKALHSFGPGPKRRARYDSPSPELNPRPSNSGREVTDLSLPRNQQNYHYT